MKIGKVPTSILKNIILDPLNNKHIKRKEILIRPSIGEDCTAVNVGNEYCVLSTDPITGATEDIGKLAAYINANDIASSGAEPIGIMVTILLPPNSTEKELSKIMKNLYEASNDINIEIIGGHTEITESVNKPIVSCTVIGKTRNKNFISSSGAKLNQDVIMTKWAGLEGTGIIISDFKDKVSNILDKSEIEDSELFLNSLSVIKEASISSDFGATCMHDVTEGGILGACWEIAECSNVGIEIYLDKIPVLNETKKICNYFKINPYRLISSGCLLITTYNTEEIMYEFKHHKIKASIIGKIIDKEKVIITNNQKISLEEPDSDELYKIK